MTEPKEIEAIELGSVELKRIGIHKDRGIEYDLYQRQNVSDNKVIFKPTEIWAGAPIGAHNLTCSPMDALNFHGMLGNYADAMMEAAHRFAMDFDLTGLRQKVAASYSPGGHGKGEISNNRDKAIRRWHKAVRFLGPKYGPTVSSVVCYEMPPDSLVKLKLGLLRLARFYRYI